MPDDPEGAYDFGLGAGFYVDATAGAVVAALPDVFLLTRELPALIAANFPVDMGRQAIIGHSMGGHGALTLALRNPGRYRSVSAFAPIVAPSHVPWGQKALGRLPRRRRARPGAPTTPSRCSKDGARVPETAGRLGHGRPLPGDAS